jgi:hypothetical protein
MPKAQRDGMPGRIVWHGVAPLGLVIFLGDGSVYRHGAPLALRKVFRDRPDMWHL